MHNVVQGANLSLIKRSKMHHKESTARMRRRFSALSSKRQSRSQSRRSLDQRSGNVSSSVRRKTLGMRMSKREFVAHGHFVCACGKRIQKNTSSAPFVVLSALPSGFETAINALKKNLSREVNDCKKFTHFFISMDILRGIWEFR